MCQWHLFLSVMWLRTDFTDKCKTATNKEIQTQNYANPLTFLTLKSVHQYYVNAVRRLPLELAQGAGAGRGAGGGEVVKSK